MTDYSALMDAHYELEDDIRKANKEGMDRELHRIREMYTGVS